MPQLLVEFQNISRIHYLWKPWFHDLPNNVAMPWNNSLPQTIFYHEFAILAKPLPSFHFQRWLGLYLRSLPIAKPLTFVCTSKGFAKFRNHGTNVDNKFPFKRSNACYYSSFHSNEPFFFKRLVSGLAITDKS